MLLALHCMPFAMRCPPATHYSESPLATGCLWVQYATCLMLLLLTFHVAYCLLPQMPLTLPLTASHMPCCIIHPLLPLGEALLLVLLTPQLDINLSTTKLLSSSHCSCCHHHIWLQYLLVMKVTAPWYFVWATSHLQKNVQFLMWLSMSWIPKSTLWHITLFVN